MRNNLQQSLFEAGQLLTQLLSDPVQLRDWVCTGKGIKADTPEAKSEVAAFSIRSLVLLFTLAINQRFASTISGMLMSTLQRLACADASATQQQQKAMSAMMQLLPRALSDMINRLGTRRTTGKAGEPLIVSSSKPGGWKGRASDLYGGKVLSPRANSPGPNPLAPPC